MTDQNHIEDATSPAVETKQPEFYVPERALIVVAHPDDIEFGAAGLATRWTEAGCVVTYCIVTDGSAGSNDPAMMPHKLVAIRKQEQLEAAKLCGVDDVRFLGYQDGVLEPTLAVRRDLTRLIREIRPQVVVLMDPTVVIADGDSYINHPDHRASGEAALYAVFPSAGTRLIFTELLTDGYEPYDVRKVYMMLTHQPTLFVDVSAVYDRKLAALRCHVSQGVHTDEVASMLKKWDSETGQKFGWQYGEAFRVITLQSDEQPAVQVEAEATVPVSQPEPVA